MTPAAIARLEIIIRGIASRTVSSVDGLVEELRASGVSDEVAKRRIEEELASGPVLAEMRRFASARAPGVLGDMVFRFARDTVAARQRNLDEFRRNDADIAGPASGATDEQRAAVEKTLDQQGIDSSAWVADEMPAPPADAPLDEEYMWVAVEDRNTCEVCAANHGRVETLAAWSEIGEPRSGACAGAENCRCVLVPTSATTDAQRQAITDAGPITT